jgi:hypothetical protein
MASSHTESTYCTVCFKKIKIFHIHTVAVAAVIFAGLVEEAGNSLVDHGKLVCGVDNPSWHEQDVPFLKLPSQ